MANFAIFIAVALSQLTTTGTTTLPISSVTRAACVLPKVSGPCKAYIPRFYYDRTTKECKQFIYGGCGGNANRFLTKATCERVCEVPDPAACVLPKVSGPCEAHIPRFYYDHTTKQCKPFVYGGCGGNGNRFLTKADCERVCYVDPCEKVDCGRCKECVPRRIFCIRAPCYQFQCMDIPNCGSITCANVLCTRCHRCEMSRKGMPKCIQQPNCCLPGQTTVNCFMDPCMFWKQQCPKAIRCVSVYCNGCNRKLYDKNLIEIPAAQCPGGIP